MRQKRPRAVAPHEVTVIRVEVIDVVGPSMKTRLDQTVLASSGDDVHGLALGGKIANATLVDVVHHLPDCRHHSRIEQELAF